MLASMIRNDGRVPGASKFPVHKIEDSPILALYQTGPKGCDEKERSKRLVGIRFRMQQATPTFKGTTYVQYNSCRICGPDVLDTTSLLPHCAPEEVLFKVKGVRFVDELGDKPKKMVELTSVDQTKEVEVTTQRSGAKRTLHYSVTFLKLFSSPRHEPNLLPTSTMVMEKDPDGWYRKFSRNLHGLRGDKPYSKLQWPPSNASHT